MIRHSTLLHIFSVSPSHNSGRQPPESHWLCLLQSASDPDSFRCAVRSLDLYIAANGQCLARRIPLWVWCNDLAYGTNYMLQNLVPLLLRPLRLVLSAETLRTVRIFLLKATHWPFVAVILGWEKWRQYWSGRPRVRATFGPATRVRNAPALLRRSPTLPLTAGTKWLPLAEQTRTVRLPVTMSSHDTAAESETLETLESAVDALKTQLEKITTLLEDEKQTRAER